MKNSMKPKDKILAVILAILMIVFGILIWYFNVYKAPSFRSSSSVSMPVVREQPIKLNNTLKTSVTVLPAPEATPPAGQQ